MGALAITKSKLCNLGKVSTKGVQKHPLCVCFSENDDSVKAVFFICVKVTAAHCIVNKKYQCMVEFPHINDKQRSGWGDAGVSLFPLLPTHRSAPGLTWRGRYSSWRPLLAYGGGAREGAAARRKAFERFEHSRSVHITQNHM